MTWIGCSSVGKTLSIFLISRKWWLLFLMKKCLVFSSSCLRWLKPTVNACGIFSSANLFEVVEKPQKCNELWSFPMISVDIIFFVIVVSKSSKKMCDRYLVSMSCKWEIISPRVPINICVSGCGFVVAFGAVNPTRKFVNWAIETHFCHVCAAARLFEHKHNICGWFLVPSAKHSIEIIIAVVFPTPAFPWIR